MKGLGALTRHVTSPSGCPDPEAFLKNLDEEFTFLDHQTFFRFIDSSPLDRGRSFSELLGLARYSNFRQALKSVSESRAIKTDFNIDVLQSQKTSSEEILRNEVRQMMLSYDALIGKSFTDTAKISEYATQIQSALEGIPLIKDCVIGKDIFEINFEEIKEKIRTTEGGEQRGKF